MTRDEFFVWAEGQDVRYEFDGFAPVAMTGGRLRHSRVMRNLHRALDRRLVGGGCEFPGPDAGVATVGDVVRYPDAVVTCSRGANDARLVPDPVAVFEVISPTSGRIDRITKLREYAAVPSIRRYVILERSSAALTVFSRVTAAEGWTATPLTADEVLMLPEIGIEIPVAELFVGTEPVEDEAADGG